MNLIKNSNAKLIEDMKIIKENIKNEIMDKAKSSFVF